MVVVVFFCLNKTGCIGVRRGMTVPVWVKGNKGVYRRITSDLILIGFPVRPRPLSLWSLVEMDT